MSRMDHILRAIPLVLCGFLLASIGCAKDPSDGWSMAWTHPDRYRSISIPMFENQTYFRGLETELTRALVVEMEASTPYKVTGPGTADTLLRGKIRSAELSGSSSPSVGGGQQRTSAVHLRGYDSSGRRVVFQPASLLRNASFNRDNSLYGTFS